MPILCYFRYSTQNKSIWEFRFLIYSIKRWLLQKIIRENIIYIGYIYRNNLNIPTIQKSLKISLYLGADSIDIKLIKYPMRWKSWSITQYHCVFCYNT
ncbi:hypothetical protein D3C81_926810 [compost metagenome]